MKRVAVLAGPVIFAACSSSSAPHNGFAGQWRGTLDHDSIVVLMTATQSADSIVNGTGTIIRTDGTSYFDIVGESSYPHLTLNISFPPSPSVTYTATYANPDSVDGSLGGEGISSSVPLVLIRQ